MKGDKRMEVTAISFNFKGITNPNCTIFREGTRSMLMISGDGFFPYLTLHFQSPQSLTNFKNGILQAYENSVGDK